MLNKWISTAKCQQCKTEDKKKQKRYYDYESDSSDYEGSIENDVYGKQKKRPTKKDNVDNVGGAENDDDDNYLSKESKIDKKPKKKKRRRKKKKRGITTYIKH